MRAFLLLIATLACGCSTLAPAPARTPEVAIAFDRQGELGMHARGFADPATQRVVTPDDPVRIASISKLVVAIGVLRLAEEGRVDLDADVSTVLGWPLRNPAFPDDAITLAMLLAHAAGVRDDVDYAIPLGGSLQATLADPAAWDASRRPGAAFHYANLNFPIVASVLERATGERFDALMQRLVLAPMRLDACFNWPTCSDAAVARAVVLTAADGSVLRDDLRGARPACPVVAAADGSCDLARWRAGENGALFSPHGGLRISARDLARIGRMLLRGGELDGVRILAPVSVERLLAPRWTFDGRNGDTQHGFFCRYGLATQTLATARSGCLDDPAGDGVERVGHAGEAYGLRSGLWLDRAAGTGVVYFVTGVPEGAPRGRSAFGVEEERMLREALGLARH
jgi:CubicO group peptidase (beta-lactamase class C family)